MKTPIITSKENSQSTITKADEKFNDDKIVILRLLRNQLYFEIKGLTIVRTIIEKSKFNGVLKDLIPILFSNPNCYIISYFIEYYNNDYIVRNIDLNNNLIQNLPPYFNTQIKPHRNSGYRICTLLKKAVFDSNLDINKDCFSFAVKFDTKSTTLVDFYHFILNYIFRGKNERILIDYIEYQPLLLTFSDNEFKEIENVEYIQQNEFKPIFVVWKSKDSYDFVSSLFTNTINEKKI